MKMALAQFASSNDPDSNIDQFRAAAAEARQLGASILAFPELANSTYFCWESDPKHFDRAETIPGPTTEAVGAIAKEMKLTILCSVFERDGRSNFNTTFITNPAGELVGRYRKTHIPLSVGRDGVQSNEKMYFRPGNLGLPVFETDHGVRIGILICFDRHFPEAARVLALKGADIIFIPTASWSARARSTWEVELRAHAKVNQVYVCGINKVGIEVEGAPTAHYYGTSLIVDPQGQTVVRAGDAEPEVVVAEFDRELLDAQRRLWQVFRDRRPDLYSELAQ